MSKQMIFSLGLAVFSSLFLWGGMLPAQAENLVQLVCGTADENQQSQSVVGMTAGIDTRVTCEVNSTLNQKTIPSLLIGKRVVGQELPVVSAANLTVNEGVQQVVLVFPAAFQPGMYQYTFSLVATADQQTLAEGVVAIGKLEGEKQPKLTVVTLDRESYAWQDEFTFQYALEVPEGYLFERKDLTVQVAMLDKNGEVGCALADATLKPRQVTGAYTLKFPDAEQCMNTLIFTLSDTTNTRLDEYRIAVPLMMTGSASEPPLTPSPVSARSVQSIVFVAFIPILLLLVFFWYLRRKKA